MGPCLRTAYSEGVTMQVENNDERDPVLRLLRDGLTRSQGSVGGRLRQALQDVAADVVPPVPAPGRDSLFTVTPDSHLNAPPPRVRHVGNFRFAVLGRNMAGGAGVADAYQHWLGGDGGERGIEFSDANMWGLADAIEASARGESEARSFQIAIERAEETGAPMAIATFAPINTRGAVIGRGRANIEGWVEAAGGRWTFEGHVTGEDEDFDFNYDPDRGWLRNAAAIAVGGIGHAAGVVDYRARYMGSIAIRASGEYGL